jgi:hypothetical protein
MWNVGKGYGLILAQEVRTVTACFFDGGLAAPFRDFGVIAAD